MNNSVNDSMLNLVKEFKDNNDKKVNENTDDMFKLETSEDGI
jgi:hypothetical protein